MKIRLSFFVWLNLLVFFVASVHAGGLINKNFGVEYLSTMSRNGATDAADIAQYNPAGVVKLDNGFYGNLGLTYLFKDYENDLYVSNDDSGLLHRVESKSDEPSYPPSLYLVYKKNKLAGFFTFTIPGGGGKVKYDDGSRTTNTYIENAAAPLSSFGLHLVNSIQSQSLEAYSIYYGYTLGAAYAINNMISIAAGVRYVDASKDAQAKMQMSLTNLGVQFGTPSTVDIDYEDTADGYNAFFGINLAPMDELNIGLRYETRAELEFKRKVNKDNTGLLIDGAKYREDLPGQVGLGMTFKASPKILLSSSITWYLERDAKLEEYQNPYNSRFKDSKLSYDVGASIQYMFSEQFSTSVGYMYTNTDIEPDNMLPEAPELDADTFSVGLCYKPQPNLTTRLSLSKVFYDNEITSDYTTYDKSIVAIGLGIEYHFGT